MKNLKLIENINAAKKQILCDLVLKNISIIDVFTQSIFLGDVAIKNGYIVGIGHYQGEVNVDCTGKYISPGLIDSHVHIESSLTTPLEYYKAALIHGVTTAICDPHEIGNVLGVEGINLMLTLSEGLPFNYYFMLPSCVPATTFESSGATLSSKELKELYKHDRVLGLGEVMDSSSLLNGNEDILEKIEDARDKNLVIDGHGASLSNKGLNTYLTAGIKTDHECITEFQVLDRIHCGMYVHLREGTAAKNLDDLLGVISTRTSRRLCFCSDDRHIDDLTKAGSIDSFINAGINYGHSIETLIQIASLNAAECYKLKDLGAIAPGYKADFIILDDIKSFSISSVYKDGIKVVENGKLLWKDLYKPSFEVKNTINIKDITLKDLDINLEGKSTLNVIEIIPNKLETLHRIFNIKDILNFKSDIEKDLLKIVLVERHKRSGNIGLGIVKGMKLKKGAIATSISHDSHNIIAIGENDDDILTAINHLKDIGGGITIAKDGQILSTLNLEVAGLMTLSPLNNLLNDLEKLHEVLKDIAPNLNFNPFLTLSFLALPVIPNIKLTDKGLFIVESCSYIPICQ